MADGGDAGRPRDLMWEAPQEITLNSPCPVCGQERLTILTVALDLPYLGDAVQTTATCLRCGFRHADVILTRAREPTRWEITVAGPESLSARVVRSTSGTLRIPELGVLVEPGPASEAVVTNVEGILVRVASVVEMLTRTAETQERRGRAGALLDRLQGVLQGHGSLTFIVDDPFGNSLVASPGATQRPLRANEVQELKTGMFVVDLERG